MKDLFVLQTANGISPSVPIGGARGVIASGTFSGGTIQLELSADNGVTWVPLNAPMTGPGYSNLSIDSQVYSLQIRAVLSGATSPSVSVSLL